MPYLLFILNVLASPQNGGPEEETRFVEEPLFIRNGRDLAAIAFNDVLYTEAFRTVLIMLEQGILDAVGPYETSTRQAGFPTFGSSHIVHAMASSSSSTRHAWYAKVSCNRRRHWISIPDGDWRFDSILALIGLNHFMCDSL